MIFYAFSLSYKNPFEPQKIHPKYEKPAAGILRTIFTLQFSARS